MVLTKRELAKRWKVTPRFIDGIDVKKLPKLDISGGAKRRTLRFFLSDVEAYESTFRLNN